jgi:hypothetical protein
MITLRPAARSQMALPRTGRHRQPAAATKTVLLCDARSIELGRIYGKASRLAFAQWRRATTCHSYPFFLEGIPGKMPQLKSAPTAFIHGPRGASLSGRFIRPGVTAWLDQHGLSVASAWRPRSRPAPEPSTVQEIPPDPSSGPVTCSSRTIKAQLGPRPRRLLHTYSRIDLELALASQVFDYG